MQIQQDRGDVVGGGAIEVAGRLVAEQQARAADERAGDRDALPLAAGQLGRAMIDPVARGRPARSTAGARARVFRTGRDQRRNEHVLEHRALRQQAVILEDEADLLVAERRELGRLSWNGLRPSSVIVPEDGGSRPPRM